jgi:DNA-binding NtrC family response regulator
MVERFTRPTVVICGSHDPEIDAISLEVNASGQYQATAVRSSDAAALGGLLEQAACVYVLLGWTKEAVDAFTDPLARRPESPLIWIGGDIDARARPTVWIPAPPSVPLLLTLIRQLTPSVEPRRMWRRKSDVIIGVSTATQALLHDLSRVATTSAPVLITGETGTGKELVARALHTSGPRSEHPMVVVNSAAIPATLFEAELFGYNRGAFTGAVAVRPGLFETAHLGTLFLDEIGELPLSLQAKLLRILETGEVSRLGSNDTRKVDVRVVAATNRSLKEEVSERRFRDDLYYRLCVCSIHLPPLRERAEDIPHLVAHHLVMLAHREKRPVPTLTRAALEKLIAYHWPGNIRELIGTLQRALLHCGNDGAIASEHIDLPSHDSAITTYADAKREFERAYYSRLMRIASGNVSMVAKLAQKTRKEIYDALSRLRLEADHFRLEP